MKSFFEYLLGTPSAVYETTGVELKTISRIFTLFTRKRLKFFDILMCFIRFFPFIIFESCFQSVKQLGDGFVLQNSSSSSFSFVIQFRFCFWHFEFQRQGGS